MPVARRIWRLAFCLGLLLVFAPSVAVAEETAQADVGGSPSAESLEFFEKQVRPLLVMHCQKCHGAKEQKGGLRLDSRAAVLAGGDSGPAVVPGKVDEGLLLDAVAYGDLYQMPPSGKLPAADLETLRRWVEMGAPWPKEDGPAAVKKSSDFDLAERANHWAFQGWIDHAPPAVKDAAWPASPIDRFILAQLEAAELSPAAAADKATLLRRASFDLVGLPPTPEEIAAFLADDSPRAWETVIDRLLASPHFGERWGRHWLDLVRYAESRGHEFDYPIPNAFQYRDYVIRAFNADLPYDQFLTEQIAGDLVDPPRRNPERGFNESILGTGFWFLGEEVHSPVDTRFDETDRTDNKLDVFSKTFLGLTVACARCHDHKFDAISTKDYYALAGYIASSSYRQAPFETIDAHRRVLGEMAARRAAAEPKLAAAVAASAKPTLERTAELLLAARETLEAGPQVAVATGAKAEPNAAVATNASEAEAWQRRIDSIAAARRLSAVVLAAWVDELRRAANDLQSPLAPWAATVGKADDSQRAAAKDSVLAAWRPQQAAAEHALDGARVILDYATCQPADWLADGFTFGLAPVQPGEIRLGADSSRPIAGVYDRATAVSAWQHLAPRPAAGAERENGRLSWLQSGRMLRTPSFKLGGGKLYYLVRGSGYAYAAVDSHRMNNGPLHGAFIREWKAGDKPQWIEHDLSVYAGRRVHIEFSPRPAEEIGAGESGLLSLAMVVEAEKAPGSLKGPPAELLAALGQQSPVNAQGVAGAYQKVFLELADRFAAGSLAKSQDQQADAALADWLFSRPELTSAPESAERAALAAAAKPVLDEQAALAASLPRESALAPALLDGSGVDECVLLRGNPKTPGEIAPRRLLEALAGADQPAPERGSGRLELARRMTDAEKHPLVARVIVNRVWQHLFGRGIVASVDNFGVLGEPPTHPELLDYLANEFVRDHWSIKRLIRSLLLTQTYRMSSAPSPESLARDPRNLLWQHMPLKRLEAEALRDAILAVSGRLDERMFGPSVPVYLTPFMEGRGRPASGPLDGAGRRSIYLNVRRNFLNTMFLAFDYPTPFTSTGRRTVSNVPAQALTMMNSPFVVAEARRWAERALAEPAASSAERVGRLYLAAFGRPPTTPESVDALAFLAEQSTRYGAAENDPRAWADLCHVLLNVKEFIFVR